MENKLMIEAIITWRAAARTRRLGIEVEIETEHADAREQVTFAPTARVDFDWWEEFVGDLPPTAPKKIIRKSRSRITYRTSKKHVITERAVAWPTDRWGRPYRPWDGHPEGLHALHWSDFDFGRSGMVLDLHDAEEIARQHSEQVEMNEYQLATWSGFGHEGTLQSGSQKSWDWGAVHHLRIVVAPDVTSEEVADWLHAIEP